MGWPLKPDQLLKIIPWNIWKIYQCFDWKYGKYPESGWYIPSKTRKYHEISLTKLVWKMVHKKNMCSSWDHSHTEVAIAWAGPEVGRFFLVYLLGHGDGVTIQWWLSGYLVG
jgi:hypothetical protein